MNTLATESKLLFVSPALEDEQTIGPGNLSSVSQMIWGAVCVSRSSKSTVHRLSKIQSVLLSVSNHFQPKKEMLTFLNLKYN